MSPQARKLKPGSRVAKGGRRERCCEEELREKGYLTWKTIRHRFLNIDLFGLFDILALSPEGDHLLFIQVKSNSCDNDTRDRIRALRMPSCCRKQVWIWKDRRGWIKEIYE